MKKESLDTIIDVETVKVNPKEHLITGTDAEDIRVSNRALMSLRFQLAESVIALNMHRKKIDELNSKQEQIMIDFEKKSAELQQMVDNTFNKTGLNVKDGWKVDLDGVRFYR
jgi:hypothetical protein